MASLTDGAIWLQKRMEEVACYVSALAVATMMTLTILEVAARALFSASMPGAYEYVSLMFVYLIYLGLGYSQRRDAHITVGILYDHFSRDIRKLIQAIYLVVVFLFFAALTWTSAVSAFNNYVMGDTVLGVIEVKTWWARAGVPIGLGLLSLRFLTQLICIFVENELLEESAINEFASEGSSQDEKK